MPLHPQARKLLDDVEKAALPPLNELTPLEARQQMLTSSDALEKPEINQVEDRRIAGPDNEIPVRIYQPGGESLPVVVYFHGGGWVIGGIETHDAYCRALANAAKAVVVSVDYRLAPEHTYPAAAEDSFAATKWAAENAQAIGGRDTGVAVAGDSAGGNLAAVVSLMARDRGGPEISRQVLIYPITDHDFQTPSYRDFANGHYLTRDAMIWFWDNYCPRDADRDQPYVAPLRNEQLAGLPRTLVITAECDPLCDEGEAYAAKLRMAGVDTTLSRYEGMLHGFIRRFDALDAAHDALAEVAAAIQ